MNCIQKIDLINYWSEWFYNHTNTFNGALGTQLAYLWPAIANDKQISVAKNSAIVVLLMKNKIPADNLIWNFIDIE